MAEGELGAVFRGLAKDAAAAGRNAAESVAKFAEKTAEIEEKNVAELAAADARAAERLQAALRNAGKDAESAGGAPGPWPVSEGVPGPAKGQQLTAPNKRHTIAGAKSGETKGENTVTLRGFENTLKEDTQQIAEGRATFDPDTQLYEVNGRSYRVKNGGTVFPVSGTGFVQLNRTEYAALQSIARAGGDVSAVREFQYNPAFRNNPDAIAKAKAIYDGTYAP
jgi:hypothetical protein